MPVYNFECDCGETKSINASMANPPIEGEIFCFHGHMMNRRWRDVIRRNIFKPYVEYNLGDKPVEFTSAKQRDEICAKNHVTYDSTKYLRKPKYTPVIDTVSDDEIANAYHKGVDKKDATLPLSSMEQETHDKGRNGM